MNSIFRTCLLLLVTLMLAASTTAAQPRPNIVLIMVDDMGWSDIGCYGSEIETPNIDRLAAEGLLFTQFYNNAKCTTTRASLLTGLYPRNGGRGQQQLISRSMLTLGEAMRHAGYATGMSGKWHNGKAERIPPLRPRLRRGLRSVGRLLQFLQSQDPRSEIQRRQHSLLRSQPDLSRVRRFPRTTTTPPTPSPITPSRPSRPTPLPESPSFITLPIPPRTIRSTPSP